MLEDILKNNKLEYIHIDTYDNKNIVKSIAKSTNIEKLRYFYVVNESARIYITPDITKKYPIYYTSIK